MWTLSLTYPESLEDEVITLLTLYGFFQFELRDPDTLLPSTPGKKGIILYFDTPEDASATLNTLKENKLQLEIAFQIIELAQQDFLKTFKQFFKPLFFEPNIVIKQSWEKTEFPKEKSVINIDPQMAFGTGSHQTTCLCLEFLHEVLAQKYPVCPAPDSQIRDSGFKEAENKLTPFSARPETRLIDLGAGTGILGIVAAKLGVKEVVFIENDPIALKVAKKNVELNGLTSPPMTFEPSLENYLAQNGSKAHIIVANIFLLTLLQLEPLIRQAVFGSGQLILSGLLKPDESSVLTHYKSHWTHLGTKQKDDWIAMVFEPKGID